jgi:predicted permease
MTTIFFHSFVSVLMALAQIFSIIIFAGLLVRKKIITQNQIQALSQATVYVFLPTLIFSNIIQKFHPEQMPYWWIIPLAAIGMIFLGIGLNSLFYIKTFKFKKNLLPLGSMQNSGYLVLPLGQLLYPNQFDEFSLYVFLYILGFNPILWSVGKVFISSNSEHEKELVWKDYITAPMIVTLISLSLVLSKLNQFVPQTIISASAILGNAAVPVATFVLGATLGSIELKSSFSFYELFASLSTKYFLVPISMFIIISLSPLKVHNPLLADFFIIEASVAPATAIILMLRTYGGNVQKIGALLLISYIFSALASPVWIALWKTFAY